MKQKYIYIVLSKSNTFPAKVIKLRTKINFIGRIENDMYNHVSISLDPKLNKMKSFARRSNNIFNSGLVNEDINSGFFSDGTVYSILVLKLPVTNKKYKKVESIINKFWKNKNKHNYNYIGIFSILFSGIGISDKKEMNFFCSEWVAKVMSDADVMQFKRKLPCVRPSMYYSLLKEHVIYEGSPTNYVVN